MIPKPLIRIFKTVARYAVFSIIAFASYLSFYSFSGNESYGFEEKRTLFSWSLAIINLFIMNTVSKSFALGDRSDTLPSEDGDSTTFGECFFSREILTENATLACLALVFPLPGGFSKLRDIFFGDTAMPEILGKLVISVVLAAIYVLINTLSHLDSRRDFKHKTISGTDPFKGRSPLALTLRTVGAALLYLFGAMLAPAAVLMVENAAVIAVKLGLIYIVAAAIALSVIVAYAKLFRRRRVFDRRLHKICNQIGTRPKNVKGFYSSVIVNHGKPNFSVNAGGVRYSCIMISPLCLSNARFFGRADCMSVFEPKIGSFSIFRLSFNIPLEHSRSATTVIILDREPNRMYVTDENGTRPIRSGDRVFGYLVCTAEEFLGNLERGGLKRIE